jgi:hypothetical protein
MNELSEQIELDGLQNVDSDVVTIVSRSAYSGGNRSELIISRAWAMPNAFTFTIEPIAQLLKKYVGDGKGWVDPFAGETSPAEITNDLNPERPTKYHLDAFEFAKIVEPERDGVLFDPPYSAHQVVEMYEGFGERKRAAVVMDILSEKVRMGGLVICCGWNTNGFGAGRGFKLVEILFVPHGGGHNDTLVTVERKVHHQERLTL